MEQSEVISEVKLMDCMDYMSMFPNQYFDLAIVDPPYGIKDAFSATSRVAKYGQMESVNDMKPSKEYFQELFRVSKNQIIWGYNHLSDMLPSCTEFIFWYKHQPVETYASGELAWTSFTKTGRCFDYPYFGNHNADKHRIHPTQKPIALYKWLIDRYLRGGQKLLDTHVGSGSSRIAAWHLGVNFYGCEIDPIYFQKMQERFDLECNGVEVVNGKKVIQQSLF